MRFLIAICVSAGCFVVSCYADQPVSKKDPVVDNPEKIKEFLQRGYASAKVSLEDVRILCDEKNWHDQNWLKQHHQKPVEIQYIRYDYIQKSGKERLNTVYYGLSAPKGDIASCTSVGADDPLSFSVFDGQYRLNYSSMKGTPYSETRIGQATLSVDHTGLFASGMGPVKLWGFSPGVMPDDVLFSPQSLIETRPERIDDLLTFQVSGTVKIKKATWKITYWLSPERSCLPLRMELRDSNGTLINCMEAKDFMKLENGTWVTKEILQRDFMPTDGEPWEVGRQTYTIEKLEIKPEIDEDKLFSTSPDSLPAGALVQDRISGLEYYVGEGAVSDKRIEKIIKQTIEEIHLAPEITKPMNMKAILENAALDNATGKPLFSDSGVFAPEATIELYGNKKNKTLGLVMTVTGVCALVIGITAIVVLTRSTVKK